MPEYECTTKHFAAGGQLVKVGDTSSFETDPGSLWKKLEVATPAKAKADEKPKQEAEAPRRRS